VQRAHFTQGHPVQEAGEIKMALLLKETSADMIARSQDMHGGQTKPVSQQFCILVYLLKYKNRIYMTVTGHNSSGV
jgi:hypothetical protein